VSKNIQLGFVDTFVPPVDPSIHLHNAPFGPSPDAIRLWAKFFNTMDQSLPTVTIPTQWMNFFTMLLLKQSSFEWAKEFLQSPAWHAITQTATGTVYFFSLPFNKPSVTISELSCSESEDATEPSGHVGNSVATQSMEPMPADSMVQTPSPSLVATQPKPRSKRGKLLHLSEATLHRSDRLHSISKGFKSTIYKEKECLGCGSHPPTLFASVVRDMGVTFCMLDKNLLSDEALHTKPTKKGVVGRPRSKKAKKDADKKDEADPKEGPSKRNK